MEIVKLPDIFRVVIMDDGTVYEKEQSTAEKKHELLKIPQVCGWGIAIFASRYILDALHGMGA